jgi:hypothetical protein
MSIQDLYLCLLILYQLETPAKKITSNSSISYPLRQATTSDYRPAPTAYLLRPVASDDESTSSLSVTDEPEDVVAAADTTELPPHNGD